MKRFLLIFLFPFVAWASSPPVSIRHCFSPNGNCAALLVQQIQNARRSVDVAIYSINHPAIVEAIVQAARHGRRVRVIVDRTQAAGRTSLHGIIVAAKVPVHVQRGSGGGIMHIKLVVIDHEIVVCGSFNFTKPADTKNDEVLVILRNKDLARQCAGRFERLWRSGP